MGAKGRGYTRAYRRDKQPKSSSKKARKGSVNPPKGNWAKGIWRGGEFHFFNELLKRFGFKK